MNAFSKNILASTTNNDVSRSLDEPHYTDYAKVTGLYLMKMVPMEPKSRGILPEIKSSNCNINWCEAEIETTPITGMAGLTTYSRRKPVTNQEWVTHIETGIYDYMTPVHFFEVKGFAKRKSVIEEEIEAASYITTLEANWDEEGAMPISEETFSSSVGFLRAYDNYLKENFLIEISAPEINPCKDATIDLEWHTANARLLINIRKKEGEYVAYYYGDKYKNNMQVKGSVPLKEFSEALAVWMKYLV